VPNFFENSSGIKLFLPGFRDIRKLMGGCEGAMAIPDAGNFPEGSGRVGPAPARHLPGNSGYPGKNEKFLLPPEQKIPV
jgi:hypothetical protein